MKILTEHIVDVIKVSEQGMDDTSHHLATLMSISVSIGAKNILELGVRRGITTKPLLLAAAITEGHVFSVDIEPTQYRPPTELAPYWTFIQQEAIAFLSIDDLEYDLVFVDDWHSTPHVKKELLLLEDKLSVNGLILMHDLMWGDTMPKYNTSTLPADHEFGGQGPWGGLQEFLKESKFKWEYCTIPTNNGLTILRKVSEV